MIDSRDDLNKRFPRVNSEKYPLTAKAIDDAKHEIDPNGDGVISKDELKDKQKKGTPLDVEGIKKEIIKRFPEVKDEVEKFNKAQESFCSDPKLIHAAADGIEKQGITITVEQTQSALDKANQFVADKLGLSKENAGKFLASNGQILGLSNSPQVKQASELLQLSQDPEGLRSLLEKHPINLRIEQGAIEESLKDGCKALKTPPAKPIGAKKSGFLTPQ